MTKIPANTPDKTDFYFDVGEILGQLAGTDIKIGAAPTNNPYICTAGIQGNRQEKVK